ncbi:TIGR01440 family protein [Paenibacillus humicola]|uniref:TIGR01440 family protein n=1 Tax=Paenibacillus humicola TaxID=3110540 RepID=UPI00237B6C70|nr:TIGR01440 family protein [Paenibacillus humicola]
MSPEWTKVAAEVETIVRELAAAGGLRKGQLLVVGASTSEVLGKRIGTSGTLEAAQAIYAGVDTARRAIGFWPAFQCCEHLNRALVVEREAAERYGLEEVAAVPVPKAGGSMAAYAYRQLANACLVETVQAHAGIDIGDTLIGMHLRRVAVPVRPSIREIGAAHVTMAYTRPKLIGGARAVYTPEQAEAADGTCE